VDALLYGGPERAGPEDHADETGGDGPRGRPAAGSSTLPSGVGDEERRRRIDDRDDAGRDLDVDDGDEEHVLAALYGDDADLGADTGARPPGVPTAQDQDADEMSRVPPPSPSPGGPERPATTDAAGPAR
jgi:hypothetical protein